eukprot:COSAG06_NODE_72605_length_168_cov_49.391304_1_plen_44_part_10
MTAAQARLMLTVIPPQRVPAALLVNMQPRHRYRASTVRRVRQTL